jgi:hypothetical protein
MLEMRLRGVRAQGLLLLRHWLRRHVTGVVIYCVDNEPGEGDELGVVHDARLSLGTKSCKHALLKLALGTVQYSSRDFVQVYCRPSRSTQILRVADEENLVRIP